MDHSYSIDTCIYSRNSGSPREETASEDSTDHTRNGSYSKKQIERELGILDSREHSAEGNDGPRPSVLQRVMDNLSHLQLSEKVFFFKDYFRPKAEFNYSLRSSVDSYTLDHAKQPEPCTISQVSTAPYTTNEFGSTINEDIKTSTLLEETEEHVSTDAASDASVSPAAGLDDQTVERVFLLFMDNSDRLAHMAITDNQHLLADKLVCNVFRKLAEVYAGDFNNTYLNCLDKQGLHPLFNLSFNIPPKTPASVRAKLEEMARDPVYYRNLTEKLYIFGLLNKFKMIHLTHLCHNFHQPLIGELWFLAMDTVVSNNQHDPESLFQCRNAVFNLNRKEEFVDYKNMPSIELGKSFVQFPQETKDTHVVIRESVREPNQADANTAQLTNRVDTARVTFPDSMRSTKSLRDPELVGDPKKNECYMSNTETLDYILKTNRLCNFDRVELLKSHFNINKPQAGDLWVQEPHNRLQTYYLADNNSVSIKVRGKLPCNVITALTIISETELAPEWVSFLRDSKDLHSYSRTSRIFKQVFDYPMIGHKETMVYGISTNVLDEANCVIISCSSPPSNKKEHEAVLRTLKAGGLADTDGYITLDAKDNCTISGYTLAKVPKKYNQKSGDICFLLFPYSDTQTIMEVYANVVPEVKLVPFKFVTYLIRKIMVGMFKRIANISRNFGESKFAQSVRERSEFYDWMDNIYQDYKINNPQTFKYDQVLTIYTYNPSIETKQF